MTNSNLKTISQNLLFLFFGQGASGVILFITMAYLARVLGPNNFGVIGFAEGVLMFFMGIASFGLDYIGTREVAKARERVKYFTEIIVSMRLLLTLISFALLIVFTLILEKPLITKYVTIIYGLSLFSAACLLEWVFQGLEKMQFVAISSMIRAIVFALGVFFLISGQEDIFTVAIIYFLSWTIPSIVLLIFYARAVGLPSFKSDFYTYKGFLKDSLPLGFLMVAGWIVHFFDSTLLFLWKGEEAAGIFNASFKPIALMITALTVYFNAIFPTMAKSAIENPSALKKVINTSIGGILTILLPVAIIGNYMDERIIELIYGKQFIKGSGVFGMLLWWPIAVGITIAYGRTLLACNKQHYIGWGALISAGLNIVLNLLLIPYWGSFGAAIAKVGGDSITLVFYFMVMKSIVDIPVFKILLCPFVAGLGMFIFLMHLSSQSIVSVIFVGFAIYMAILFLMSRIVPGWIKSMVSETRAA